jgi:hypothetical protein
MASKYAVALMALLGSAAAQGFNSSTSASTTSSAAVPMFTDGSKPTVGGTTFLIQTDTSYQGQLLRLARKRQSDSSIQSCLATCSADVDCEGTAFVQDTMSCLYYSSVDTATQADTPGTDFALVQDRASSSTTSEVFNGTSSAGTSSTGVALPSGNSTASATGPAGVTGGAGNNSTSARPTRSVTGGAGNNSTRPTGSASRTSSGVSTTTSGAAVPSTPSTLLTINGVLFLIEIDISKKGITIDFALIFAKRAGQSLDDCLTTCAANTNCAATSFTESDGVCTFYTSVTSGSETVDDNSTFATVISRAGATGSGATNGTSGGNNTTPAAPSNATAESFICPAFNAAVLQSSTNVTFSISCSSFLIGTTFDIQGTFSKRQTFNNGLPQTLSNCVDLCSLSEECVGTTFDIARSTCSYYSSISYSTVINGFDSAVRVQDNSNDGGEVVTTTVAGQVTTLTVPGATTTQYVAGATSTATVYSTITSTVYANGGGATAFPSGAVVTSVVSVSTMTYVNTVSTITVPQNQNAAATVTVTVGGSGSGAGNYAPVVTQTVYQTVDQAGNVIGSSTAGAVAGGAAGNGMYPTVTVFAACSTPAAQQDTTVWTTVYV